MAEVGYIHFELTTLGRAWTSVLTLSYSSDILTKSYNKIDIYVCMVVT